jgi:exopolysaccharide biosynthesis polyprenyl glycosylphosphotransferase
MNCFIEDFDGLPFEVHQPLSVNIYYKTIKLAFDFCFALTLLIFLSPLFLIIALLIKIASPNGPIFYVQERVGLNGKPFGMIKFRTMIPNAESKTGPVMVSTQTETRYIPCGNLLRKTSIDELPQLINILKGEMSLVGPRPERAFFVEKFKQNIPYFDLRHKVKGGITGWAQINGRSVLTNRPEHKIKYDLYYIKNWSFILDIKIIIKTIFIVLKREEAY